jgi:cobalt-zinc-cadmium efflux system protein
MEGVPGNVVVDEVRGALAAIPGVKAIAHMHIWSITSGRPAATLELALDAGADPAKTTQRVKEVLEERYKIAHATVEIDWDGSPGVCCLPGQDVRADAMH